MRYLVLVIIILASSINADLLVIDPGHGGPGADMYNNGGGYNNYNGAVGPVYGLAEQWVNWQVAQSLIAKYTSSTFWVLTRDSMTQNVSLIQRVAVADSLGNHFLSIHHNGLPLYFSQQSEVRWCGDSLNSAGEPRLPEARDNTFASNCRSKPLWF